MVTWLPFLGRAGPIKLPGRELRASCRSKSRLLLTTRLVVIGRTLCFCTISCEDTFGLAEG